jgi:transcriptional regulator of NAD metabolism
MTGSKKLSGEERRARIVQILKETGSPITGSELATKTNVSRQVIVGDIHLLKVKNEPIIATSQGYIYLNQTRTIPYFEKTITCRHLPDELEHEFNVIVDYGVTIKEICVDHPVFGKITAAIMVSNRINVKNFIDNLNQSKIPFLSDLPINTHLLTLSSACEPTLLKVELELKKAGICIERMFEINH